MFIHSSSRFIVSSVFWILHCAGEVQCFGLKFSELKLCIELSRYLLPYTLFSTARLLLLIPNQSLKWRPIMITSLEISLYLWHIGVNFFFITISLVVAWSTSPGYHHKQKKERWAYSHIGSVSRYRLTKLSVSSLPVMSFKHGEKNGVNLFELSTLRVHMAQTKTSKGFRETR